VVELNLRSPSYLTGSKSFNRLKRACDTVFNQPQVFLFADLSLDSRNPPAAAADSAATVPATPDIIAKFPARTVAPVIDTFANVHMPSFRAPANSCPHSGGKSEEANYNRGVWRDWAMEIHEYLSLLLLPSAPADRLRAAESAVDPYLSTYAIDEPLQAAAITRVQLVGLVSAKWAEAFWADVNGLLGALGKEKAAWVGMVVHGFDDIPFGPMGKQRGVLEACGNAYSVLKLPGEGGTMTWEIAGGENE
jgi:ribonuclease P/MRP protein subunit RPP40